MDNGDFYDFMNAYLGFGVQGAVLLRAFAFLCIAAMILFSR